MTETEWLTCTDPDPILEFIISRATERKLLLFGCACWRAVWEHVKPASRRFVEATEQYADERITWEQLKAVWDMIDGKDSDSLHRWLHSSMREKLTWELTGFHAASKGFDGTAMTPDDWLNQLKTQSDMLREVFGNPFRSPHVHSSRLKWNGNAIRRLAHSIYDRRAFDQMPILADALEEAGCTDAAILNHCRQPGEHVRGCWVLDLLLGKE